MLKHLLPQHPTVGMIITFAIASYLIGHNSRTYMTYNAGLECQTDETWCFELRIMEQDFIDDDFIGYRKGCVTNTTVLEFIEGSQPRDGWLNRHYELYARVKHNCTSDGAYEEAQFDLPFVPVRASRSTIGFNAVLHNKKGKQPEMIGTVVHDGDKFDNWVNFFL